MYHPRPARNQYLLFRLRLRRAMLIPYYIGSLGKIAKADMANLLPQFTANMVIVARNSNPVNEL